MSVYGLVDDQAPRLVLPGHEKGEDHQEFISSIALWLDVEDIWK